MRLDVVSIVTEHIYAELLRTAEDEPDTVYEDVVRDHTQRITITFKDGRMVEVVISEA